MRSRLFDKGGIGVVIAFCCDLSVRLLYTVLT